MLHRDILLMVVVCAVWAFHFTVIKFGVSYAPPLLYAAVRMSLLALILSPFLRIYPGRMVEVLSVGVLMGGLNFGLLFVGTQLTAPSLAAIAMELTVPFATILAVLFLGERVGWRRVLGIAMAVSGVTLMALDPAEFAFDLGLALVACAALSEAAGAVIVRRLKGVPPLRIQAWVALVGGIVLSLGTLTFDTDHLAALRSGGWALGSAILYSTLLSSLFGHTMYYHLIQKRGVTEIAPFTLLIPIFAVIIGLVFFGETLTLKLMAGGAFAIGGVAIIIFRTREKETNAELSALTPAHQPPGYGGPEEEALNSETRLSQGGATLQNAKDPSV